MIKKIRKEILNRKGQKVSIVVFGSRNKKDIFEGNIEDIYNNIFTVKLLTNELKSFSYTDILTNTIKLKFNNVK